MIIHRNWTLICWNLWSWGFDSAQSCLGANLLFPPVLGQMLPLLHGNVNSSKMIITEFQEFCRQQTAPTSSPSELSSPQNSPENVPTRWNARVIYVSISFTCLKSCSIICLWIISTKCIHFNQSNINKTVNMCLNVFIHKFWKTNKPKCV